MLTSSDMSLLITLIEGTVMSLVALGLLAYINYKCYKYHVHDLKAFGLVIASSVLAMGVEWVFDDYKSLSLAFLIGLAYLAYISDLVIERRELRS